jgi:hypothetical protein
LTRYDPGTILGDMKNEATCKASEWPVGRYFGDTCICGQHVAQFTVFAVDSDGDFNLGSYGTLDEAVAGIARLRRERRLSHVRVFANLTAGVSNDTGAVVHRE